MEEVKDLTQDRQAYAAAVLERIAADGGMYHLSVDERDEVRLGLAEIERGEVATDAEAAVVTP
jgi:predicted transcriptional regulator